MRDTIIRRLTKLGACSHAVEWAKTQPSCQAAWDVCERGDYMMWLLGRLSGATGSRQRRNLVLCACDCAATAVRYSGKHRTVVRRCLRMTRQWAKGVGSTDDVYAAANAAYAAAADAANAAAYAAAYAAYAANAAAADAAYAATNAAAYAAYAAAADAATYAAANKTCANIVRTHYPKPPKF